MTSAIAFPAVYETCLQEYADEERICEITAAVLQLLSEKHANIGDSLRVLKKAKKTLKASVNVADWGAPLSCTHPQNEITLPSDIRDIVVDEFNRRRAAAANQNAEVR
jgi:hypothetical protein